MLITAFAEVPPPTHPTLKAASVSTQQRQVGKFVVHEGLISTGSITRFKRPGRQTLTESRWHHFACHSTRNLDSKLRSRQKFTISIVTQCMTPSPSSSRSPFTQPMTQPFFTISAISS